MSTGYIDYLKKIEYTYTQRALDDEVCLYAAHYLVQSEIYFLWLAFPGRTLC